MIEQVNINHSEVKHSTGYGLNILVWLSLLSLTILTVTISGLDLGNYVLLVAMAIAAIKSAFVINIFMHIRFEDRLFKVFLFLVVATLTVVFILTAFDVFLR